MDDLDLAAIERLDQDVFDCSDESSFEDESDLPLPDCIGIDSAVQDDEELRLKQRENQPKRMKTRSEAERELELKALRPDSIRRQILEKSLNCGHNKINQAPKVEDSVEETASKTHVMNIVEKAGMSGIDKEKINEIIHEASKGSLFYKRQAQRQEEIHKSIQKMLTKVKLASPLQVTNAKLTCDKIVAEVEKQRTFNKIIVHFDLDMFFAAVEIRDNPELADKPIAVGGDSMVSTSNYIARKFGVRAAMPGFIAKKLCPNLLLIKPNGIKYRKASSEVFSVLEQYDPELTGMSLDEAYLDLTEYIKNTLEQDTTDLSELQEYYDTTLPKIWWTRASKVVQEIREAIYEKTKLTCSAGIACNTLLAKIATDINKPNGQFIIEGYPKEVNNFIRDTAVGKVSGIGKVSSQFLNALEIKTCGDIFEKRHFLPLVFYEINVRFYLRLALGDGPTCIKSDEQRKSKSVERTFSAVRDPLMLLDKLDSICEELCNKYLKPYRIRGRTVTIKLKRNTFTTTTKSYSLLVPTNDKLVIYSAAKNLLLSEIAQEPPEISFRLLGVKLSNLADESVNTNQLTIDSMLRNQELANPQKQQKEIDLPVVKKELVINEITESNSSSNTESSRDTNSSEQDYALACPNQLSQTEQKQSEPNDEDFQCPYCFKPFSDFTLLETHVESCNLKTSIDIYKPFFSQKLIVKQEHCDDASINSNRQSEDKKPKILPLLSPNENLNSRKRKRETTLTDFLDRTPSSSVSQPAPSTKSPKVSFYQKFIESNSQSLTRSPKVEPLQCPYCMHGFVNFRALETHVMICTKNNNR